MSARTCPSIPAGLHHLVPFSGQTTPDLGAILGPHGTRRKTHEHRSTSRRPPQCTLLRLEPRDAPAAPREYDVRDDRRRPGAGLGGVAAVAGRRSAAPLVRPPARPHGVLQVQLSAI